MAESSSKYNAWFERHYTPEDIEQLLNPDDCKPAFSNTTSASARKLPARRRSNLIIVAPEENRYEFTREVHCL